MGKDSLTGFTSSALTGFTCYDSAAVLLEAKFSFPKQPITDQRSEVARETCPFGAIQGNISSGQLVFDQEFDFYKGCRLVCFKP